METIIKGRDGIEYVVSGGELVERCLHRTTTDKSSGKERWIVCADCNKTMIYNKDTTAPSSLESFSDSFRAMHGREPSGIELTSLL